MKEFLVRLMTLFVSLSILSSCSKSRLTPSDPPAATVSKPSFFELEVAPPANDYKVAYFGETHVHSSYSLDSDFDGNRNGPEQIYRLAKGEQVEIYGQKHSLKRPLDFVAVSDHAENIGEM